MPPISNLPPVFPQCSPRAILDFRPNANVGFLTETFAYLFLQRMEKNQNRIDLTFGLRIFSISKKRFFEHQGLFVFFEHPAFFFDTHRVFSALGHTLVFEHPVFFSHPKFFQHPKQKTLSLTAIPLTFKLPSHRTFFKGECIAGQSQASGLASCLSVKQGGRGWAKEICTKTKNMFTSHMI